MDAAPRLVLPTKSLAEPNELDYVPAIWQQERGILARWSWERSSDNPSNYPDVGYETDAAGRFTGEQQ